MCSMCFMNPCHSRCPNAPEPIVVRTCSRCGYGIEKGEPYLDSEEGPICEECLSDMTAREYLKFVGESLTTA